MQTKDTTILKHDQLLSITRKFDSIDEHRFLNSCLKGIYQRKLISDNVYYPIDVENYASKTGTSLGQAYTELLELITKYREEVEIPIEGNKIWCTSIIYDYIRDDEAKSIQVQFNRKIIPLISGNMTPGNFCSYDDRMDKVPSNRRYLMGELIQRNLWQLKDKDSFTLTIQAIREGINLKEGEYREYKELNRCIIQKTIKDLADNLGIKMVAKGNKSRVVFSRG